MPAVVRYQVSRGEADCGSALERGQAVSRSNRIGPACDRRVQRPVLNATHGRVVLHRHAFDKDDSSIVSSLLGRCCPSAVAWLVRTGVIDAIDGHACWPWSHVFGESLERIAPAVAHGYTGTAISRIARDRGIETSRLDGNPNVVNRLTRFPVTPIDGARYLAHPAAATSGSPKAKMCAHHIQFCAALTATSPLHALQPGRDAVFASSQNGKAPKRSACHIDERFGATLWATLVRHV